ncbi:MAG: SurA N-terminal domain-containing protein [Candidatus Microsaccharimonas sp.]
MQLKLKEIMKKLLSKIRRNKQPQEPAGRITTDTLAEHRERVLAGGRKFKYPVQYQRHKLVINAIIIAISALILAVALFWYMLYQAQNTSEFTYRVTKVIPAPVAVVDGEQVRYSDYLMKYRSAEHYLIEKEQIDPNTEDGKSQLNYVKTEAMNDAIADAYAKKLARELSIQVSDADLETFLKQQRQSSDGEVTEATYNAVILDYYDWSPGEYREAMTNKLLRQRVAYAVDTTAEEISKKVESAVSSGTTDLQSIANSLNNEKQNSVTYMPAAWVPKNNQDGGLAEAAGKLQKGQVSTAVQTPSGNGYYYVKLTDINDAQVQYEYLFIPLTEFNAKLDQIKKDNKLVTFIELDDSTISATSTSKTDTQ